MDEQIHRRGSAGRAQLICWVSVFAATVGAGSPPQGRAGEKRWGGGPLDKVKPGISQGHQFRRQLAGSLTSFVCAI